MSSPSNPEDSNASREAGQPRTKSGSEVVDEVFLASEWNDSERRPFDDLPPEPLMRDSERPPVRRRVWLPIILFVLTMASTFLAGATHWVPDDLVAGNPISWRLQVLKHWDDGLIYMTCLLAMLLAHEMGHFLATVYYRIPASFPYFLPLPITPIGTLGAVIRMDNRDADRKQMFDIGIAGPLAGLVVAIPLLVVGIQQLNLTTPANGPLHLGLPWGLKLLMQQLAPAGYHGQGTIDIQHVNPYFMAGWVGLLVTALNMMPVSQLDGGHVTYTLFGKKAHWIARGFMVITIATMVATGSYQMSLMIGLILLIGIDHPPTSNDRIPIGAVRMAIGLASLIIPILCLTLQPITQPR